MKVHQTPPLFDCEQIEEVNNAKPASACNFSSQASPKLKPIDRCQMIFRTVEIEKLIPEDHEARAIWEFVGRLDLNTYYNDIKSKEGSAGRAALDPRLMICIWAYSYGKGIASAREIAQLCEFDPAYQWLTGMTSVNYHSLSDFRVDHGEALDNLMIEILALLSAEKLITMERVMHDGTKIKARASGKSFRREETLLEHLKLAQEQISELEKIQSTDEYSSFRQKAQERAVRERKEKLEKSLSELEKIRSIKKSQKEKDEARASMTDPESRTMKQNNGGFSPSYNIQISTDAKNGLIVGVGATQAGNDNGELIPSLERIEKFTGQVPEQIVADAGYTTKSNIMEMADGETEFFGSMPATSAPNTMKKRDGDPDFDIKAFSYDATDNTFTCPDGQKMCLKARTEENASIISKYYAEKGVCQKCRFQKQCCPQNSLKGRSIQQTVDKPEIAAFKNKMKTEEAKAIYKKRSEIAEFPNAWIKEKMGLRQFSLRGLVKVGMEALWACITYNIQRWIGLQWRRRWAKSEG